MGKINSRAKGQRGEREVVHLVQPVVDAAWAEMGCGVAGKIIRGDLQMFRADKPDMSRNIDQVRNGGCDLHGLPWLAIEVKFCENFTLDKWWEQATRQAKIRSNVVKHSVEPVLIYRRSRIPWRVQVYGTIDGLPNRKVRVDISLKAWLASLRGQCLASFLPHRETNNG